MIQQLLQGLVELILDTQILAWVIQVVLLDPVMYPGALKAFAKEICRNDLLNFGRLHFFFPDSRLALDLNTDKALKASSFFESLLNEQTGHSLLSSTRLHAADFASCC